jgi:DNA (cytosine-5)-methyltransferase 1
VKTNELRQRERDSLYTESEKQLFTEDGNIYRYIGDERVDKFEEGQMATTTYPNGFGHGTRVHNESITLNATEIPSVKKNLRIRKLTPKECVRLMGFTDQDHAAMKSVVSDSRIYMQCGNSIVVQVLEGIFRELL